MTNQTINELRIEIHTLKYENDSLIKEITELKEYFGMLECELEALMEANTELKNLQDKM